MIRNHYLINIRCQSFLFLLNFAQLGLSDSSKLHMKESPSTYCSSICLYVYLDLYLFIIMRSFKGKYQKKEILTFHFNAIVL